MTNLLVLMLVTCAVHFRSKDICKYLQSSRVQAAFDIWGNGHLSSVREVLNQFRGTIFSLFQGASCYNIFVKRNNDKEVKLAINTHFMTSPNTEYTFSFMVNQI